MTINIRHRGIELTEAIKAYVQKKTEVLAKYAGLVRHADIEVGKTTAHHKNGDVFVCRALFELEHGGTMRIDREAKDLYKAIDKVHDHARQELGEHHRQMLTRAEAPA